MRNSKLYNLIAELLAERSALLKGYKITALLNPETQREAFIVDLATAPANLLYQDGYIFVESHLSLDKFYDPKETSAQVHGFSIIHYTETYQNPETNAKITVHRYLDEHGKYRSSQIKSFSMTDGVDFEVLPVNAELLTYLQTNCEVSIKFIRLLQKEKSQRFKAAMQQAEHLNQKACALSWDLKTAAKRQDYLRITAEHLTQLTQGQRYANDEDDPYIVGRIQYLTTLLRKFKVTAPVAVADAPTPAIPASALAIATEETDQVTAAATSSGAAAAVIAPVDRIEGPLAAASDTLPSKLIEQEAAQIIELQEFENKLDAMLKTEAAITAQDVIARHKIVTEISDIILYLSFTEKLGNKKLVKSIKRIEKKIDTIPDIRQEFEKFCLAGNLAAVEQLFSFVQIDYPMCNKLLMKTLIEKSKQLQDLLNICEFFYANSPIYREYILALDIIYISLKKEFSASFLIWAAILENVEFYNLLLRQGVNPNAVGLKLETIGLSNLTALLYFSEGTNLTPYLHKLFEHGVTTSDSDFEIISGEEFGDVSDLSNLNPAALIKAREIMATASGPRVFAPSSMRIVQLETILQVCCNRNNDVAILKELLAHSHLAQVAYALAAQAHALKKGFAYSAHPEPIICCKSVEEFSRLAQQEPEYLAKHPISFLVLSDDPTKANALLNANILAASLKLKYRNLIAVRLQHFIENECDYLVKKAERIAPENTRLEVFCYYACVIILQLQPQQNFMSYQKIIRYFCKIAKAYEKYQEIQDACASYTNALKILEVAPVAIATQLRETEICKFAHRERERLTRQQHQPAALRFSGIAGTAATSTSVSRRQATDSSAAAGASHPTASAPTTEEKKNVNRKILKEKAKAK